MAVERLASTVVPISLDAAAHFHMGAASNGPYSSQRFIDGLLPFSHLMPLAGHFAILALDMGVVHSRGGTLTFVRPLPTHIDPAAHSAFSDSGMLMQ